MLMATFSNILNTGTLLNSTLINNTLITGTLSAILVSAINAFGIETSWSLKKLLLSWQSQSL